MSKQVSDRIRSTRTTTTVVRDTAEPTGQGIEIGAAFGPRRLHQGQHAQARRRRREMRLVLPVDHDQARPPGKQRRRQGGGIKNGGRGIIAERRAGQRAQVGVLPALLPRRGKTRGAESLGPGPAQRRHPRRAGVARRCASCPAAAPA